jgi:hypothetical protein
MIDERDKTFKKKVLPGHDRTLPYQNLTWMPTKQSTTMANHGKGSALEGARRSLA